MKKIEKFIKTACAYTVIMLVVLYLFALIMKIQNNGISFGRFALVLAFGAVLTCAELIFKIKSIGKIWRLILHYCILLFSFTVIFTWSGMLGKGSDIFTSFFVFTFFYFVAYGIIMLIKYLYRKLGYQQSSKVRANATQKQSAYKPRFKDGDD